MRRSIGVLAVVVALVSVAGSVLALRFAWKRHLAAVELALDPIGPEPAPLPGSITARPIVLLFGDSRVAQWNPLPALATGSVVARGRGGETTAMARLRLAREIDAVRPDVVVIETGVNDLKAVGYFPERAAALVGGVESNLRAILGTIDDGGRSAVLLTVFPPAAPDLLHRLAWSGDVGGAVRDANARLRGLGGDRLTLLDCDPVLAPGGALDARYAADTLHLNAAGYAALNAAIEPVLARLAAQVSAGPEGGAAGGHEAGASARP